MVTQVVNALWTTSSPHLVAQPLDLRLLGHLHRHGLGLFGHPSGHGDLLQLHHHRLHDKTSLGTGTLNSSGKATFSTSSLPAGTTYVEAVYSASGNYLGSTSNVVAQVVNALGTTSSLTSSANPSTYGSSVTFTDTVSASTGTPAGTVTFYSCTTNTCTTKTSLGTGTLNSSGKATYSTSSLPAGTTYVEAVYSASGNYLRLHLQCGVPGGQRARDHLEPHLVGQPLDLRLLGHLHRHGLGLFGHPGGHGDLLQLHHHTCTTKTSLGTGTLSSGKATYSTSSLPVGTTYVEAVYSASGNYLGSPPTWWPRWSSSVPSVCAPAATTTTSSAPGVPVPQRDERQRLHLRLRRQLLDQRLRRERLHRRR